MTAERARLAGRNQTVVGSPVYDVMRRQISVAAKAA
jgi:hypothetical protein